MRKFFFQVTLNLLAINLAEAAVRALSRRIWPPKDACS